MSVNSNLHLRPRQLAATCVKCWRSSAIAALIVVQLAVHAAECRCDESIPAVSRSQSPAERWNLPPGTAGDIREAASRSLSLLESSSAVAMNERRCFMCHHQGLPAMVMLTARDRGIVVNSLHVDQLLKHTRSSLERGRDAYREGRGQGGKVDMAGYALWTLNRGGQPADELTNEVARFLADYQFDRVFWSPSAIRPPSESSDMTSTFLALRALRDFGGVAIADAADNNDAARSPMAFDDPDKLAARIRNVRKWLAETKPGDTESQVFRLRALCLAECETALITEQVRRLVGEQCADGGWTQLPGQTDSRSDAYATGTVLLVLLEHGGEVVEASVVNRALQYLLETQYPDGSWHVVSRSRPIQTWFESGFPHEKDQFISATGTAWATLSLLEMLPVHEGGQATPDP